MDQLHLLPWLRAVLQHGGCWAARQQAAGETSSVTRPFQLLSCASLRGHDRPLHNTFSKLNLALAPLLRRTRRERPSAPTASSRCAGEWRAPLPGDLSRLSEPRHCGRPELKTFGSGPQRGFHNQRLLFNSNTPCMSTSVAIEAQPLAVACWPSAAPTVAIGRHAGISTF